MTGKQNSSNSAAFSATPVSAGAALDTDAQQRELAFRRLLGRTPTMLHYLAADGTVLEVSRRWLSALGYARDEVVGRHIGTFMTAESADYARRMLRQLLRAGDCDDLPFEMVARNGDVIDVSVTISAERDDQGEPQCMLMSVVDVTRGNALAQVTLACIADGVITTDAKGLVVYMNKVAEDMTHWRAGNARGQPLGHVLQLVDETSRAPIAAPATGARAALSGVLIGQTGRETPIEQTVSPIQGHNDHIYGSVVVIRDVTESRRLRNQISHQATHDRLTGLLNRHEFSRELEALILNVNDINSRHALCYIDLDQFKSINDTCGHAAGDQLLSQLADLFQQIVRTGDILARMGGDQFAILLTGCAQINAQRLIRTLLGRIQAFRFHWESKRFKISASIGMVAIDATTKDAEFALQAAESACASARDAGRDRVHVYNAQDDRFCRRRGELRWMRRVEAALEEDRFVLFAQPIRQLRVTDAPDNYEILLRMVDRDDSLIAPGQFLPAVERFNLSGAVDRWVVHKSLTTIARIQSFAPANRFWTINLSGQSISDPFFQDYLISELGRHEITHDGICFEITETAAIADMARAIEFMRALRDRGCHLALDDFGTGVSSFAYLKSLPVDFVKIDGEFVRDIVDDKVDRAMVRSINEISQLMGTRTIAEYVENADILQCLREIGVDYVQGYGVGRPQPIETFIEPPLPPAANGTFGLPAIP